MNAIKAKLRARRGMTLTELLTAILILGLVTLGVVVGVNSSLRVYRQSVTISDAQTLTSTLSIALMDELRYARDPKTEDSTTTFTSATFGPESSVGTNTDGHITIKDKELVGSGAYTPGLTAKADVSYSGGLFKVKVQVLRAGTSGELVREVEFSVRPLNG